MKKEECYHLGYVSKIHGFKGEVIIISEEEITLQLSETESVFIEINGQLIPFFFESIQQSSSSAIVKFIDISNEVQARTLLKTNVFFPLSILPEKRPDNLSPASLKGFTVIDDVHGNIGVVKNILEMPQQLILEISNGSKNILVPANEEIIHKIDKKNRTIFIDAPGGLIDLYLEGSD
jgi:16S rRNA processing protein RimM